MIAIINYGMGNVRSVFNSLEYIGEDSVITSDPNIIEEASHLILPGVGAFGDAMRNLKERNLIGILNEQVLEKKKPILGICLGLQLMAKDSEEHGKHEGLGWFDAKVVKFDLKDKGLAIPHMGWNDISVKKTNPLFSGLKENQLTFYFVHSFHIVCENSRDVAAACDYGIIFTAAIQKENIFATQFHSEKSQDNGLQVLQNFANWNPVDENVKEKNYSKVSD